MNGTRLDPESLARECEALRQRVEALETENNELKATLIARAQCPGALEGEDVSEERRAELRVAESERKYGELVELVNSIILRWTPDGRITFLNEFGQRFFGYSATEVVGRHVMGTIVPAADDEGRDLRQLMEEICANPAAFEQNVNENMRSNGERVWIAWTNRIVQDDHGRVKEILSVGTDVTEKRHAEEAIRELNTSLEKRVTERTKELAVARDRAESADRLKSAFLATMSHELRTPLNSIIGFSGVLSQGLAGPLTDEQSKQLAMVCSSAERLLALINDVLDLSKIEAGQMRLVYKDFDLASSVERVIAAMVPLAQRKGLQLKATIAPFEGRVVSDQCRFEQILLNLIANGIKFTERGQVTVGVSLVNAKVIVRVEDTGMGIKETELGLLFGPFMQLDSGLTRKHEGTGLGLAICKKLTELLGGRIWVESTQGVGSAFSFELPVVGGKP